MGPPAVAVPFRLEEIPHPGDEVLRLRRLDTCGTGPLSGNEGNRHAITLCGEGVEERFHVPGAAAETVEEHHCVGLGRGGRLMVLAVGEPVPGKGRPRTGTGCSYDTA
jgi:hypothetical protein